MHPSQPLEGLESASRARFEAELLTAMLFKVFESANKRSGITKNPFYTLACLLIFFFILN
jgi:hypothetical protein